MCCEQRVRQSLNCKLVVVVSVVMLLYVLESVLVLSRRGRAATVQPCDDLCRTLTGPGADHHRRRTTDSPSARRTLNLTDVKTPAAGGHRLCVVVPYKNRWAELQQFAPFLDKFLSQQQVEHRIVVVNQTDNLRFNRATLINIGFIYSRTTAGCDYMCMHDVDLVPINPEISYTWPDYGGVVHLTAPHLHPLYHYKTFIGGIVLVKNDVFIKVNGMSNMFWGWGKEDDDFYKRLRSSNIKLFRPAHISTGINDTFRHLHGKDRTRDKSASQEQKKAFKVMDKSTGLSTTGKMYDIVANYMLTLNGSDVTVLDVTLRCNMKVTPWCRPIR